MGRNIMAGIAGVVIAMLSVWLVQKIGHAVYAPPADLDAKDLDAMRVHVESLPVGAFLFVIASYFIGTAVGTCAACAIGTMLPRVFAMLVSCVMLVATAMNVAMIPHPVWFIVLAVVAIVIAAWLGTKCARATAGIAT